MRVPLALLGSWLALAASSLAVAQQQPAQEGPPSQALPEPEPEPAPAAPAEPPPAPPTAEPPPPIEPEPVFAPAGSATETALGEADEIIVTGTRIKRAQAFVASAPVEVIDRKQLEYSGATNLSDVVQHLTVAQGSGFQFTPGAPGTTSINLRGLGAGNTLVLINGRRMAPSGGGISTHFADISTIPLAAVERIEILKGGASSIYGSDAVAGVVNIITHRNFDGVRIEIDGQTTEELDQQDATISGAIGASSERGRVLAGINYFRRTELTGDERDVTRGGQRYSRQGFPPTLVAPGLNPGNPGQVYFVDPSCETANSSDVASEALGDICRFDIRRFRSLLGNAERVSGFGSAEYDLTDHTTLFTELNVSRLRGDGISSHFPVPPPLPVVPADHVDNPFGTDVQLLFRPFGEDEPAVRNTADDDTVRVVAGLKGDLEDAADDTLFESWEWEVYASFGVSRFRNIIQDTLREPLQDALNSCSDPSDLSRCFNPFYSAIDGTGTPNSEAVKQSIQGQMEVLNDHALQTYNAGMAGSLFELPGGDLGIAFGAEIRHESRSTDLDHDANELRYHFLIGNSDASAERDVYSAYLELRWPFFDGVELQTAARAEHYTDIEDTAVSPTAGLTLTLAELFGRENVAPAFRRLQLRGHVASAFRSPTIYQSFPGFAIIPTLFAIPGQSVPSFVPVQSFGNADLEPETALAASGGVLWRPIDEISLLGDFWHYDYQDRIGSESPYLRVEQWAAGDPCAPPDGIVVSDDCQLARVLVKQVNLSGHVVTNGIDFGLMLEFTGETFGGGRDDWGTIGLGAQGTYTLTFDVPRSEIPNSAIVGGSDDPNVTGSIECEGSSAVDLDGDPSNDAENDTDACSVVGHRNAYGTIAAFPPAIARWRVNFPVTWSFAGHGASVIAHYTSALEDDIDTGRAGDFEDEIDAFVTVDLQYGYTLREVIGEELTLRVGVYNVFDRPPPTVFTALDGYEFEVHDPRGRMFYGKLISQF